MVTHADHVDSIQCPPFCVKCDDEDGDDDEHGGGDDDESER